MRMGGLYAIIGQAIWIQMVIATLPHNSLLLFSPNIDYRGILNRNHNVTFVAAASLQLLARAKL